MLRDNASERPARCRVLLPVPPDGCYDYGCPGEVPPAGAFVTVPLGPRTVTGVVWDGLPAPRAAPARLRNIVGWRRDLPCVPESLRRFVDWVAAYNMAPPGRLLRMAVGQVLAPAPGPVPGYRHAGPPPPGFRLTAARARVMALLAGGAVRSGADLRREAGVGGPVLRGLVAAGVLAEVALPRYPAPALPDATRAGPDLSPEQAAAADRLVCKVTARRFGTTLLEGVTGSGKTEVYLEAVAAALRAGRQALILLPEIALTPQWLARVAARFGAPPVVWHSEVPPPRRRASWLAVARGEARIVVGARSALFLPFADPGVLVVDEEHEAAYRQESVDDGPGVSYHARDMGVVRARIGGFPVILASATPSMESRVNVAGGRYDRLSLTRRHGGARLPAIAAIDLRRDRPPAGAFLSAGLRAALTDGLAAGEQSLLFLNRRGYAPLTLCRRCGHRFSCPDCTAWLVEHRSRRRLCCHHCGHGIARPTACPACGVEGELAACGPGIERITEEVAALLPRARLLEMSSDRIQGTEAARQAVAAMTAGAADIVIGTQMIAKGHHFPNLTLVGVVDADLGLRGGDLRAAERTFQLLRQVGGRAGRESRPGRVLLQTHDPAHPVLAALLSGEDKAFHRLEEDGRRAGGWPPFGRLAALVVSGRDEAAVDAVAAALRRAAPAAPGLRVLGPAPAPLAMLRGRVRRRLLLKTGRRIAVQPVLRDWLGRVAVPSRVRVRVDVDPYSFL